MTPGLWLSIASLAVGMTQVPARADTYAGITLHASARVPDMPSRVAPAGAHGVAHGVGAGTVSPATATATAAAAPAGRRCELMLSESAIDYGAVTRYRLEGHGSARELSFGKRRMALHVTCTTPLLPGLVFRGPSHAGDYRFGPTGKVTLTLSDVQFDGRPVLLGNATMVGELPAQAARSVRFLPGQVIVPVLDGRPARGTRLSAMVDIEPVVPRDSSRVATPTTLETNGMFQVLWH